VRNGRNLTLVDHPSTIDLRSAIERTSERWGGEPVSGGGPLREPDRAERDAQVVGVLLSRDGWVSA
jgi:hypothetical protein